MKCIFGILIVLSFFACTSKMNKWENDMRSFISSSDSTANVLNNQLDSSEIATSIKDASLVWNQAKMEFQNDTLNLTDLKLLDAFNVAYNNSKQLSSELTSCKKAVRLQKERLLLLQADIENESGDRSSYCASIQQEKDELTIIRTHANDIRRRFEELKTSMEQFQPILSR